MTAYLIVNYSVDDPDGYRNYQQNSAGALRIPEECQVRVFDTNSETIEGQGAGTHTVVLEFESREKAKEIYNAGDYQAVLGLRLGATSKHFAVLVDGL